MSVIDQFTPSVVTKCRTTPKRKMKTFIKIFLLLLALFSKTECSSRAKRTLLFQTPEFNQVQFVAGVGIPVPLDDTSVTVGWTVKIPYQHVSNSTFFTNPLGGFQKRAALRVNIPSRFDFYRVFEDATHRLGNGGKSCMLRSICEAAETPLLASGLTGKLLHLFLTPSTTDDPITSSGDTEYINAEIAGRQGADCWSLYPCAQSVVQQFTTSQEVPKM